MIGGKVSGRTIAKAVREAITKLGPAGTYNDVLNEIRVAGLRCSKMCYLKHYQSIHSGQQPMTGTRLPLEEQTQHESPKTVEVPDDVGRSRLTDFVRFAVAVEAVGGIKRAREFLAVMENLGGII